MEVTHVRDDEQTVVVEGEHSWQALCLYVKPPSSISERHGREILSGTIQNQVIWCSMCEATLRAKMRDALPPVDKSGPSQMPAKHSSLVQIQPGGPDVRTEYEFDYSQAKPNRFAKEDLTR